MTYIGNFLFSMSVRAAGTAKVKGTGTLEAEDAAAFSSLEVEGISSGIFKMVARVEADGSLLSRVGKDVKSNQVEQAD